ncbi:MAG: cell division protein FtsK, partial [Lachnospiraceae bacterium]|nr:cell division protein FtsK [Lachnospiraceae bacterium]
MDAITQAEIFALIAEVNAFADNSETLINNSRSTYEQNKQTLLNRHNSTLLQLEKSYKNNCAAISSKSKQAIKEAQQMLADIDALDTRLSQVDKYYRKTKEKKEAELADKTSDRYQDVADYFAILEQIKGDYATISKKYSEDILPALINGLNYFFSSKRKKDYEELIILRNTLKLFEQEIEEILPTLTTEELSQQKTAYFSKRTELLNIHKKELANLEETYRITLDNIAGKICTALDDILPDVLVDFLHSQMVEYSKTQNKVNTGHRIENGILHMSFVDYPVDFFVQSGIVASLIKEKCASLLVNGSIRMPITLTTKNAPTWFVVSDNSNNSALQAFSHSIMFSVLSACPVAKLAFSIVDPENRGNSVAPYFDAKKKLPELFGEQIIIDREHILEKINSLNDRIEDILQDKLGTRFDTIYDYAEENPSYEISSELFVLYDFPKGFDEQGLAGLRNVLRNGSKCGIYTLILYSPTTGNDRDEFVQSLKTIESLSVVIKQQGESFIMRGMPLIYISMPDKTNFAKFFSKYMLIFE